MVGTFRTLTKVLLTSIPKDPAQLVSPNTDNEAINCEPGQLSEGRDRGSKLNMEVLQFRVRQKKLEPIATISLLLNFRLLALALGCLPTPGLIMVCSKNSLQTATKSSNDLRVIAVKCRNSK